jgi:hypothetical protein
MNVLARSLALLSGISALAGPLAVAQTAAPAPAPGQSPRPGLTAQQSKQAVELARGAMQELRKKTEGANEPEADRREFVVNVELLNTKENESPAGAEPEKAKGTEKAPEPRKPSTPRAVVTSYRYFDDITVFSTVDLNTGKVVDVQAAQHVPTPLSDGEFDEAADLAREKSDEVKRLYERYGDQISVYPQFSQYVVRDDPRRHRVVHLNYRVGKRDLSYPRPQVDLTTRAVVVPAPEAEPKTPVRRRGGTN